MIGDLVDCDLHRIEAADPYSNSYDATVARNENEQNNDARPEIANPLESIEQYDTVLLGSPIWNVQPPMIMTTFLDSHDFAGRTIRPFVTYAVSGLGRTETVYSSALPAARLERGLAIQTAGPMSQAGRDPGLDQLLCHVHQLDVVVLRHPS
jgi:hypothetical protein